MSTFCPHCGAASHEGAAFCPSTGKSLAPPAPAPTPAPMPSEPMVEYGVGETILLSVITCGIFGLVRFYQAAQSYRRALPGGAPNFEWQFWTHLGTGLLGWATVSIFVGVPLIIVSIVIGALMLGEVCAARAELAKRAGVAPMLSSGGTQVTLWVLGEVLAIGVVGLVLLVVQAVQFFQDHNTVAKALERRAT